MSTDLLTQLKALHLYGMAEAWSELSAEMPQRKQVSPQASCVKPADQRRNGRTPAVQPEIPDESRKVSDSPRSGEIRLG